MQMQLQHRTTQVMKVQVTFCNLEHNSRQFEPFRASVWGLEVLSVQEQAEMQARRAAAAERKKQMDGKPNQLQQELQEPLGSDVVSSFECSMYAEDCTSIPVSLCTHLLTQSG